MSIRVHPWLRADASLRKPWTKMMAGLVAVALGLMAAGCATTDPDAESDIPWNAPQQWEGAPGIPGLEGR